MKILKANTDDYVTLTSVMRKSKAHWGYSNEQLQLWENELTVSQDYIYNQHVYKLINENTVIGFYSFQKKTSDTIKLDNLFVLPEYIGMGLGKLLLNDCYVKALKLGYSKVILDADTNAEGFYLKFGFTVIGQKATSVPNRFMPIMIKIVQRDDNRMR